MLKDNTGAVHTAYTWHLMNENDSGWKGMPFSSSNWTHTVYLQNVTVTHSNTCHFNATFINQCKGWQR